METNYRVRRNVSRRPNAVNIKHRNSSVRKGDLAPKTKVRAVKLAVCLTILLVAVIIKLIMPGTIESMRDRMLSIISGNVDYKSALATLGEAISGDKKLTDAIPEAYEYTFGIIDESSVADYQQAAVVKDGIKEETEKKEIEVVTHQGISETAKGEEKDANDEGNKEAEVVTAFKNSQSQYSNMEIPEDVTYEMPEITLEHVWPAEGTVSSSFGYRIHPNEGTVKFHYGTDIGAEKGGDVLSFADGTVRAVGDSSSYGNYIIVEHADGLETLYAHCGEILVQQGADVSKGDIIAYVGDTGNATSACLHFELTVDGIYLNPEYYV